MTGIIVSIIFACVFIREDLFFRMRVLEYERAKKVENKRKTLVKSPEDGKWSITSAFLNCRNEVLLSHEQIVLQLKDELEKYMSYYSSMCDDDMTEQFQKYVDEGICSSAYSYVIMQGLSNLFKVNILLYNSDERAACYFIAQEKDCIFPRTYNYVEDTVSMLKESNVYSALRDVPGKYRK